MTTKHPGKTLMRAVLPAPPAITDKAKISYAVLCYYCQRKRKVATLPTGDTEWRHPHVNICTNCALTLALFLVNHRKGKADKL